MSEGDDRRVGEPHVLDGVSNGFIHCKYVAFEFRFRTAATNPNTFLYNTCPITALDSPSWNRKQWYSASMVSEDGDGVLLGENLTLSTVQHWSAFDPELRRADRRCRA